MWTPHFLCFLERNKQEVSSTSYWGFKCPSQWIIILTLILFLPHTSTLPSARALLWTSLAHSSILLVLTTASYAVYLCSVSTWIEVSSCSRTTFMSHGSPTYLCIRTKSVNPSNLSLWRLPATWEHCWRIHRYEMLCAGSPVVEKLAWLIWDYQRMEVPFCSNLWQKHHGTEAFNFLWDLWRLFSLLCYSFGLILWKKKDEYKDIVQAQKKTNIQI